jgi:Domain of unknown function (DUF4333)
MLRGRAPSRGALRSRGSVFGKGPRLRLLTFSACAFALALTSCARSLDTQGLEETLGVELQRRLGIEATVSCPDDVEVAAGGTFTCTATAAGGDVTRIEVTQTDDQGNVSWKVVETG